MDNTKEKDYKLINIGKKTFISVFVLLFSLMVFAIILTYILPKGMFGADADGNIDYSTYIKTENQSGINIFKGILSPILMLGTSDGITVIMLSLFLVLISGAFQVMNDVNGIKSIVNIIVKKFDKKRFLLISVIAFVFMFVGAVLGLFEEVLTLLPIITIITVSLGYDSFTGFLICIIACGFGFSSAITNPFTVIFASNIIGANPVKNIYYRIIIFFVMYLLLLLYVWIYTKMIKSNPVKSLTYNRDKKLSEGLVTENIIENEKKITLTYFIFLSVVLFTIIVCSSLSFLRDYTVVLLSVVFLFGGIISGIIADGNCKKVLKSYLGGIISTLPSVIFVFMASSIKYILVEGNVLATITNEINNLIESKNVFMVAIILFFIVIALEFFISSSTAKAIFVMSILSVLSLGISKEMLVLIYTFADGYTNVLFPTSPVLLIGLSMIEVSYFKWIKKSWWLFLITFSLVILFIALGLAIGF